MSLSKKVEENMIHLLSQQSSLNDGDDRREEEEDEDEDCPDLYTPEELELGKEFRAYVSACQRADAKINDCKYDKEKAFQKYTAACRRFAEKTDDGCDGAAAAASNNTGGGRGGRDMENPYYDRYNSSKDDDMYAAKPAYDPYYGVYSGGSSGPGSLGLGSGYNDSRSYYDRYGYGFPGDAYGPATGSSRYGYGGYPYVPAGYRTVAYQAPPPAFSASLYTQPPPMQDSYSPPTAAAPLSMFRRPGSHIRYCYS